MRRRAGAFAADTNGHSTHPSRRPAIVLAALAAFATRADAQSLPRVEPVARIGCATCDGPEAFAGITQLATGPDGHVWVLDSAEPFIRVFTADGTRVKALGREGSGPGELRTPIFIDIRPDGSFSTVDARLMRLTRHAPDGSEVSAHPVGVRFPVAVAASSNGDIWLASTDFRSPTLFLARWPHGEDSASIARSLDRTFPMKDDTAPSAFIALAARNDGGAAIADGTSFYHIGILDREGRKTADIRRDVERARRTAAELNAERERMRRATERLGAMIRAEGGTGNVPAPAVAELKRHFMIDALQFDERGRLWVRTERGTPEVSVFDIFEADNRFAGELRVPGRMTRFAIGRGVLIGIVYDENEAQYVQVYRIIEPS